MRTGVGCFLLLCFLIGVSSGCSTLAKSDEKALQECWGVWTNEIYNEIQNKAAKIVYLPDMTWFAYDYDFAIQPRWRGTISIIDKWKDTEGNCWYQITTNQLKMDTIVYELWKISESGMVLESVWNTGFIPKHIDPTFESYTIYYRDTYSARTIAVND
jgi:hypothetical protein